jgi:hypothetical protein
MPNIEGRVSMEVPGVEKRKDARYSSVARIGIHGFEGESFLSDISNGGFRMESTTYIALVPGESYTIKITPEPAANQGSFELRVDVRWIQGIVSSFGAGFSLAESQADQLFKKYVDYLSENKPPLK